MMAERGYVLTTGWADAGDGIAVAEIEAAVDHPAIPEGTVSILEPPADPANAAEKCAQIDEMLAQHGYRRLDRTFGVVLLASTMINVAPALRREFLATCRHHLADGGVVVFQQNPPSWFEESGQAPRVRDDPSGIRRIIRSARREPPRMHIEVEYQVGGRVWTHAWASYEIGADELTGDLAAARLRFGRWLADDHAWFTAHAG